MLSVSSIFDIQEDLDVASDQEKELDNKTPDDGSICFRSFEDDDVLHLPDTESIEKCEPENYFRPQNRVTASNKSKLRATNATSFSEILEHNIRPLIDTSWEDKNEIIDLLFPEDAFKIRKKMESILMMAQTYRKSRNLISVSEKFTSGAEEIVENFSLIRVQEYLEAAIQGFTEHSYQLGYIRFAKLRDLKLDSLSILYRNMIEVEASIKTLYKSQVHPKIKKLAEIINYLGTPIRNSGLTLVLTEKVEKQLLLEIEKQLEDTFNTLLFYGHGNCQKSNYNILITTEEFIGIFPTKSFNLVIIYNSSVSHLFERSTSLFCEKSITFYMKLPPRFDGGALFKYGVKSMMPEKKKEEIENIIQDQEHETSDSEGSNLTTIICSSVIPFHDEVRMHLDDKHNILVLEKLFRSSLTDEIMMQFPNITIDFRSGIMFRHISFMTSNVTFHSVCYDLLKAQLSYKNIYIIFYYDDTINDLIWENIFHFIGKLHTIVSLLEEKQFELTMLMSDLTTSKGSENIAAMISNIVGFVSDKTRVEFKFDKTLVTDFVSKEEKTLCEIPGINPFTAIVLLSEYSLKDVKTIPDHVFHEKYQSWPSSFRHTFLLSRLKTIKTADLEERSNTDYNIPRFSGQNNQCDEKTTTNRSALENIIPLIESQLYSPPMELNSSY